VIHFDSSFLIDLLRETTGDRLGPAFDLIESLDEHELLGVSVAVVCELRAGAELARLPSREHAALDELFEGFDIAYPDHRYAAVYARLLAATRRGRPPVATMDLLIATAAVVDDAALVTRNVKDFRRVPGLRVLGY
jgi:tRNA(fMet)-specific endonuclease VapC